MNWFLTDSTKEASGVGQVVPHMINAVESADSFTAGDTVETGAGTTVAATTRAATPIDTLIRVAVRRRFPTPSATASAPTRPMYFAVPIICLQPCRGETMAHRSGVESRNPNRRPRIVRR